MNLAAIKYATGGLKRILRWRHRRRSQTNHQCLSSWQDGIGYAILGRNGKGIRLHRAGWLPAPVPESLPLRRDDDTECSLVVSFSDYRLLSIEPPQVPQEELSQAVRWVVASRLPTEPIEEMTVDFIRMDPRVTAAKPELLAVIAHNAALRQRLLAASQAGLQPKVIDIPEMAQRNLAHLASGRDDMGLLSLTPMGGLLTVTRQGELCFTRHFEIDWSRLVGEDAWAAQAQVERLSLELQRSLDYIERHHAAWEIGTLHIASTLPPARFDQIAAALNAACVPFEPSRWIEGADRLDAETLARVWFALGGALRGLSGEA